MHYNTEKCPDCYNFGACIILWGESCRVQGGTKIPRVEAKTHYRDMDRAEQEEQARQQAVRDQLRAAREANEVKRRPMWMERAAGME